jgi:DNA-binding beta-propeller fold protein YncE
VAIAGISASWRGPVGAGEPIAGQRLDYRGESCRNIIDWYACIATRVSAVRKAPVGAFFGETEGEREMPEGLRRLGRLAVSSVLIIAALAVGASAAGAEGFEFERAFGPNGSDLEVFQSATSVAVDQTAGRVYVLDRKADAIYKFDLAGNPVDFGGSSPDISGNKLSGFSIGDFVSRQIAVDSISHRIYVPNEDDPGEWGGTVLEAFQGNGEPAPFSGIPGNPNRITGFDGLLGVAVDAEGNIYTSEFGKEFKGEGLSVYRPSGEQVVPEKQVIGSGVAVNISGVVYLLENGEQLFRLNPSQFPVEPGTTYAQGPRVDSRNARAVAVDPATDRVFDTEVFVEKGNTIAQAAIFDAEDHLEATFGGPGEAGELKSPTGIAVGAEGERAYITQSPEGGPAQVKIFKEKLFVGPPTIDRERVSDVTDSSATLKAQINPNTLDTTYWWEYGLGDCEVVECTKVPLAGVSIGDGHKGVDVTQLITGLQPQTVYHYRVVAENAEDITKGVVETFTTQGLGLAFALSDRRVWEMVSPSNKYSGVLVNSGETAIQASESGNSLAYASLGTIAGEPTSARLPEPATVLAKRKSSGAWESDDLTPTHTVATRLLPNTEFKLFSSDLLRAELEPADRTPLSPEASERTPYLWNDGTPPLFSPLVNPGNVPAGTEFGPEPGNIINPIRIEGASEDLTHVILKSDKVPLVEGAPGKSIYLWQGGELELVSERPEAEGGAPVEGMLGSGLGSVRNAVSDDGSRVFWAPDDSYGQAGIELPALYVRDTVARKSFRLDVVKSGPGGGDVNPAFNGASADGSVVFFTDSHHLTADASPTGRDLYRCEIGVVGGGLGCADLIDVSAPIDGSGESGEAVDLASDFSQDGSRVYFVARGVLDETPNEAGQAAEAEEPNLYLWEEGQSVRFIAKLTDNDYALWGGRSTLKTGFAYYISADASPDGRFFAFSSEGSLTGDENLSSSGEPNTEVFVYDAEGSTRLTCVSCNPTGSAAVGEQLPSVVEFFPPDPIGIWAGRWVAATLPEATQTEPNGRSLRRPRAVLNNGRVFFNSIEPLVPADSNGNWDVYQYQPVGIGTCTLQSSGAAVSRLGVGCVGLISSGGSEGDAGFLDATPSGNDAFFLTRGQLSVLDNDDEVDAYDARVDGIAAELQPTEECAGDACRPAPVPPVQAPAASETFRGATTPVICGKKQRKVRRHGKVVCVRKKHKMHGKHRKKRAGKTRSAQR